MSDAEVLVRATDVTKNFATSDGELPVLGGISLDIREGEIVALLGRSGCGKSTFLRCVAGLIQPSSGEVLFRGVPLRGTNPGVSMVFQNAALLPWETVLSNVELGLEQSGVDAGARRDAAIAAIDLVGLDGFEAAYPKELSGGMRQRVGIARALVAEPDLLLMDEPFSALDVLTAENLRGELVELWESRALGVRSILIVTHNIEEAVGLADRIVVLDPNPGRIAEILVNDLPRPRRRTEAAFEAFVDRIYALMTGRGRHVDGAEPAAASTDSVVAAAVPAVAQGVSPHAVPADAGAVAASIANTPMPDASVDAISGLAEVLAGMGALPGAAVELDVVADELVFEIDDLFPLTDALELLRFAAVTDGGIALTDLGVSFARADIQMSKQMFATQSAAHAPLVAAVVRGLTAAGTDRIGEGLFVDTLRRSYSKKEARRQLEVAVNWGRYGELFDYDKRAGEFVLDESARALADTFDPGAGT